jgi:hypothetical protein
MHRPWNPEEVIADYPLDVVLRWAAAHAAAHAASRSCVEASDCDDDPQSVAFERTVPPTSMILTVAPRRAA